MGKKEADNGSNLLDWKPVRNLKWETREGESIVLLVPKFKNAILVHYLMPRLAKPNIRLELDAYGSFVWKHCDGQTTVLDIAEGMKAAFGESTDPSYQRIGSFIRQLLRNEFVRLG
jgi:hypothetical protein